MEILQAKDAVIGKFLEYVPGAIEGEKYIPKAEFPLVPRNAFTIYKRRLGDDYNPD